MKSELTLRDINKLEKFRYYLMEWLGFYDNYDFDTRLSFIAKGFEVFKNNKMNHFDFFAFHKDRIKILTALKWASHILVISFIMLISSINVFNLILVIAWFLIAEVVFSGVSAKNHRYLNEFLKSDNKHFKTLININANDKNEIQKIRDEFLSIEIGENIDNKQEIQKNHSDSQTIAIMTSKKEKRLKSNDFLDYLNIPKELNKREFFENFLNDLNNDNLDYTVKFEVHDEKWTMINNTQISASARNIRYAYFLKYLKEKKLINSTFPTSAPAILKLLEKYFDDLDDNQQAFQAAKALTSISYKKFFESISSNKFSIDK